MNGAQDLGGMMGFGPVVSEPDEPVFHAAWERRVFALAMAMGFTGAWSLDASRSARESLPPAEYLASSYYAIWFAALENQVRAHGLATPDEIVGGTSSTAPRALPRVLTAEAVAPRFRAGFPSDRAAPAPARFRLGEAVTARNEHPSGHTRLPRYVRGRQGLVERVHGAFVFPDTHAHGASENPQWLYTIGFDGTELWGGEAEAGQRVTVACFESYLQPAQGA